MMLPGRTARRRSRNSAAAQPRRGSRPRLEFLEERAVPAAFVVTSLLDAGAGSLREAIELAQANPGRDEITFASALKGGTIELTTNAASDFGRTALVVNHALVIDDAGAPGLTISGGSARRILAVGREGDFTIRNLTLADGLAKGGDGGYGGGGGATGVPLDGAGANQPGADFNADVTWRNLAAPGVRPAVAFEDGRARTTPRSFRQQVEAVLARFAARPTLTPRLGAGFLRIRPR